MTAADELLAAVQRFHDQHELERVEIDELRRERDEALTDRDEAFARLADLEKLRDTVYERATAALRAALYELVFPGELAAAEEPAAAETAPGPDLAPGSGAPDDEKSNTAGPDAVQPLACWCGRSFESEQDLAVHLDDGHGAEPTCWCGRSFKSEQGLAVHAGRAHNGVRKRPESVPAPAPEPSTVDQPEPARVDDTLPAPTVMTASAPITTSPPGASIEWAELRAEVESARAPSAAEVAAVASTAGVCVGCAHPARRHEDGGYCMVGDCECALLVTA